MFLWISGPKGLDMEIVLKRSIEKGIGFVLGKFFFPNPDDGLETLRLNFTNGNEEQIGHSIKTLSEVVKKMEQDRSIRGKGNE